jgi:hypothetical protein
MLLWPGTDTCFSLCAPLVPFEIVISLCARLEEDKLSETKTPCLASACPGQPREAHRPHWGTGWPSHLAETSKELGSPPGAQPAYFREQGNVTPGSQSHNISRTARSPGT